MFISLCWHQRVKMIIYSKEMAGILSFPDDSGNIMAEQDRGVGVLNKVLYWGAPTPRSNPLHFYKPFLTEKGTHFEFNTFYW